MDRVRRPRLATPAEERVAAALGGCGLAWSYEPHRLVIARDACGRVASACVPDFHVPALGVYLEVCEGSPRRLNRKRAKLRRLARAHPSVTVHLLGPREIARLEAAPWPFLQELSQPRAA